MDRKEGIVVATFTSPSSGEKCVVYELNGHFDDEGRPVYAIAREEDLERKLDA